MTRKQLEKCISYMNAISIGMSDGEIKERFDIEISDDVTMEEALNLFIEKYGIKFSNIETSNVEQNIKEGLYLTIDTDGFTYINQWSDDKHWIDNNHSSFDNKKRKIVKWFEINDSFNGITKRLISECYQRSGVETIYITESKFSNIEKLTPIVNNFFTLHPHLYNNSDIFNICNGEYSVSNKLYGELEGYNELKKALLYYFFIR